MDKQNSDSVSVTFDINYQKVNRNFIEENLVDPTCYHLS